MFPVGIEKLKLHNVGEAEDISNLTPYYNDDPHALTSFLLKTITPNAFVGVSNLPYCQECEPPVAVGDVFFGALAGHSRIQYSATVAHVASVRSVWLRIQTFDRD